MIHVTRSEKKTIKDRLKSLSNKFVFHNANTFYPIPTFRISYDYYDPTYLDLMWLSYGIQIKLPITIQREWR